ncbi:MAG: HAMP domain-containing histidine kinase [Ruminococcus sp.]|nr:HAMP domain-containing histidine kinase [Ruminococcus sp.]
MFRKVQLKFFGIITSILIAIFIALLIGINIIMDILMEHQTKVALEQVASGIEYDSDTNTFSFTNIHKNEPPKPDFPEYRTEKTTTSIPVSDTTTETATTPPPVSDTITEVITEIESYTESIAMEITEPDTEPPVTEITEPDTEIITTETEQITTEEFIQPPTKPEWKPDENWTKPNDWREPPTDWNNWENPYPDNDRKRPNHEIWGEGGFLPTAYTLTPVLEGYTVLTEKHNPPPDDSFIKNKPENHVPKSFDSIDFFVIMADENGVYLASHNNDELTEETAQEYINQILDNKNNAGTTGNYSFYTKEKTNGTVIVLSDRTAEINMMRKLKRTTWFVGIISIVFLSAGAYFLSGLIVRPLKDTFEKQKQFISDASHELKTPLTVISANADVLAGEIGDNKWLNYIQDQTERMNVLVNDLLSLTRLENKSSNFIQKEFNLSSAITNTALPFECQAFELNRNFVINIDENIFVFGSEQHIKQMAGIFIDNALKYSKDGGTVRVSLTKEDGKAVLSVYNTGMGVKESEKYKIFERFYRSDESRNRSTGGYGLGLAIAKSIIDKHKFKIDVENHEGKSICFIVTM